MSCTEVYGVPKDGGELVHLGDLRNAFRGAMWIWTELAKKYFPDDNTYTAIMGGNKLWGLINDERLSDTEWYAFVSTFDALIVPNELMDVVADALESFSPGTENLHGQAVLLRQAKKDGLRGVCWNQTSVNGDPWRMRDDEDEDSERYFNIDTDETWYPGGKKIRFLTSREDYEPEYDDEDEDETG